MMFTPYVFKRLAILLFLLSLCVSSLAFAQRRPKLRPVRRDFFAGKFLLIPRDARPGSLQQPRMIAEVADHDLISPPVRILGNFDQVSAWAKTIDFDEVNGAIVSLDSTSIRETGPDRIELIKYIRSQRPGVPVYGSLTLANASNQIPQIALDSIAGGSLDFLLISNAEGRQKTPPANLKNEIDSRKLGDQIALNDDPETATITLLARMINNRFGFAPKILPVYSSASGRDAVANGSSTPLHQLINDRIGKSGGIELKQTAEVARIVDVLFFVHTARTREQDRAAFVESIAQTIDRNVRIALVDLSETMESRDAVIADLRRRKLLDKLASYAAFDPENESPGEAIDRALAHASSFLVSIRFLRDDIDRVQRFDRAHISLLLSRYLTDWNFPLHLRSKLPSQSKDSVETFALGEMKQFLEELFNEQFRRNTHSFLLHNGERAQFEVRQFQRLLTRLYPQADSPQTFEVEARPSVYLVHLGNAAVPQLRSEKSWQITNTDNLEERARRRWDSIDWRGFKTDAESVEMAVKVSPQSKQQTDSQDGYAIISKRSKTLRRIEITVSTPQGAFYALGKLEQMGFDGLLAQDFQINEKPAVAQRGIIESVSGSNMSHPDRLEMIRFLGRVRMNRYYYFPRVETSAAREDEKIRGLLLVADENFVQLVYGIFVNRTMLRSSDRGFSAIAGKLDRLSALGVRRFAVSFENSAEPAQSALIARIREHLRKFGDVELSVLSNQDGETGSLCLSPKRGDWPIASEEAGVLIVKPSRWFQASKPMIAASSEYAWSGQSYNPARAFDSAMNLLYDERTRTGMRAFSQVLGDCRKETSSFAQKTTELQTALEAISGTRERGLLRGELAQFMTRATP